MDIVPYLSISAVPLLLNVFDALYFPAESVTTVAFTALMCWSPCFRRLIPRLLQFLSELFASLCRSLTDPCISQNEGPGAWGGRPMLPLLALRQLQQSCFMSLVDIRGRKAAFAECPLVVHFLALQRTSEERSRKHRRKSKGYF